MPSAKIALVTGGSRGVGRGIAHALGEAGATVYLTGRTSAREEPPGPGTIEHVAREVDGLGGRGIPVRCDHEKADEIAALFARIASESRRLDLLVNNVHSGVAALVDGLGRDFWELDPAIWDAMNGAGLRGHYIASVHAARLMVPRGRGLIVNVSSFGSLGYLFNAAYGVGKAALDRMTADLAHELRPKGVAVVSVWPGLVRTELTDDLLKDASPGYRRIFEAYAEPPSRAGAAVAALAADPEVLRHTGQALVAAEVMGARSPRSLSVLLRALLPPRYGRLAALAPPLRVPRFAVALVLRRVSDVLRRDGGFK